MTKKEMRELDAWIFANLFGGIIYMTSKDWVDAGSETGNHIVVLDQNPRHLVPNYTTDAAAAMLVLEKCIESGYTPLLSRAFHSNERAEMFTVRNGDMGDEYAIGETLPIAVAKFARGLFV